MFVYYGGKIIFQYISENNYTAIKHNLFNEIYVLDYSNNHYFFYSPMNSNSLVFNPKYKICAFFYDLTYKILHCHTLVLVIRKSEGQYVLKKLLLKRVFDSSDIIQFTKIFSKKEAYDSKYKYSSFYQFDSSYFTICNGHCIHLYEKFSESSILIQKIEIGFMSTPFPVIKDNRFHLLSSESFLYRLTMIEKSKASFSIFKDLTLNFTDDKFREMMDMLKVIIYTKIEIDNIEFKDLHLYCKEFFSYYDLFSYVQNLSHILNEENVLFFLNFNLTNHKLQALFLFCVVNSNYDFLRLIFDLLFFSVLDENQPNTQFVYYLTLFIEEIKDFLRNFPSLDYSSMSTEINSKIFYGYSDRISDFISN